MSDVLVEPILSDILGQQLEVGDIVAFGVKNQRSKPMRVGVLSKIRHRNENWGPNKGNLVLHPTIAEVSSSWKRDNEKVVQTRLNFVDTIIKLPNTSPYNDGNVGYIQEQILDNQSALEILETELNK
tara:strand:- start:67 stop:447 length:381 start_codon:yes stop_codon:yes gene_type:complete